MLLIIFLIFVSVLSGSIFAHTNNLRFGQLRKRRTKILLVERTVEEQGSVTALKIGVANRDYHYLSQNEIGGRRGFDSNPDWNVLRFLQYCVDRLCGVKSPIAEVVNG